MSIRRSSRQTRAPRRPDEDMTVAQARDHAQWHSSVNTSTDAEVEGDELQADGQAPAGGVNLAPGEVEGGELHAVGQAPAAAANTIAEGGEHDGDDHVSAAADDANGRMNLATATPRELAMKLIHLEGMVGITIPTATASTAQPASSTGQELSTEETLEMRDGPEANRSLGGGSLEGLEIGVTCPQGETIVLLGCSFGEPNDSDVRMHESGALSKARSTLDLVGGLAQEQLQDAMRGAAPDGFKFMIDTSSTPVEVSSADLPWQSEFLGFRTLGELSEVVFGVQTADKLIEPISVTNMTRAWQQRLQERLQVGAEFLLSATTHIYVVYVWYEQMTGLPLQVEPPSGMDWVPDSTVGMSMVSSTEVRGPSPGFYPPVALRSVAVTSPAVGQVERPSQLSYMQYLLDQYFGHLKIQQAAWCANRGYGTAYRHYLLWRCVEHMQLLLQGLSIGSVTDAMRTDAAVLYLGGHPGTYRNNRPHFSKAAVGYVRASAVQVGDERRADAVMLVKTWSLFTNGTVIDAENSSVLPVTTDGLMEDGAAVGLSWEDFKRLVLRFSS